MRVLSEELWRRSSTPGTLPSPTIQDVLPHGRLHRGHLQGLRPHREQRLQKAGIVASVLGKAMQVSDGI